MKTDSFSRAGLLGFIRISCLLIGAIVHTADLAAQDEAERLFLFDEFKPGTIVFQDGSKADVLLNYNTVSGIFSVDTGSEEVMQLANLDVVSAVIVQGRTFVNAGEGRMYEQIALGENATIYVSRRNKMYVKGKKGAYGSVSTLSNIKSLSEASVGGQHTNLKPAEEYALRPNETCYIKHNGSFKSLTSAKALKRIFKGHEAEIETYVSQNKPDFSSLDDMKNLVVFLHTLTNDPNK